MRNLLTKLNITINANEVICELNIKTFAQLITKWNREFWKLELETFESVLLENNYKEIEWNKYNKIKREKDVLWTILVFALGVFLYTMVQMLL